MILWWDSVAHSRIFVKLNMNLNKRETSFFIVHGLVLNFSWQGMETIFVKTCQLFTFYNNKAFQSQTVGIGSSFCILNTINSSFAWEADAQNNCIYVFFAIVVIESCWPICSLVSKDNSSLDYKSYLDGVMPHESAHIFEILKIPFEKHKTHCIKFSK